MKDWDPENRPTESELSTARARLKTIVARLQDLPEDEARAALSRFQTDLFQDFADVWSLLRNNIQPAGPISMADIPPQLKKRFVSRAEDKFLLQIYPKHNIREQHALEAFIRQLRELDPDVTGSPVIGYESIRAMQQGYIEAAIYALVAIVLVTFGTLRRSHRYPAGPPAAGPRHGLGRRPDVAVQVAVQRGQPGCRPAHHRHRDRKPAFTSSTVFERTTG